jgi:hypothetical protein
MVHVSDAILTLIFPIKIATDGGRVAIALFGRGTKLVIGQIFLTALLLVGLVGSDLFLFYFSFLSEYFEGLRRQLMFLKRFSHQVFPINTVAFQTGNEIPSRNEVDDISFSRVLVSVASFSLAFLVLVPFQ